MWPILLDMTKDECRRMLRRLELEAYGSLVSALRAQGSLNSEKQKVLQDIAAALSISAERHRAEIRRVVNDERLTTIAHCMTGDDTSDEWAIEGRRTIPLMPRLPPQTAYSVIADDEANKASVDNEKLPHPANTERKRPLPGSVSEYKSPPFRASPEGSTKLTNQVPPEEPTVKKRRVGVNVESSTLAQHLMMAPKISRLQQLYRQKTKAILKSHSKQRTPSQTVNSAQKSAIKEEEPVSEEPNALENKITAPTMTNENQVPKIKNVSVSKPPIQSTSHIKVHPPTVTPSEGSAKSIKICPARKVMTSTSRSHTTPQKLIIVSTAQCTPPSSILQRTLTIPFVKTISMKNLDKVKVISTTTIQTATSNVATVSNQKPKLLTVQTKVKSGSSGKTVNIPFIQGVQLQALQSKGAIKMFPLSTSTKTTSSNSLYIVNSNNSVSGVTTTNKSPIMAAKALPSVPMDSKTNIYILKKDEMPNDVRLNTPLEKSEKSSVLAEILKASGVISSDDTSGFSEHDIENEISQYTSISTPEIDTIDAVGNSVDEVRLCAESESSKTIADYTEFQTESNHTEVGEEDCNKVMELDPETGYYAMKEQPEEEEEEDEPTENYIMHMEQMHNDFDMPALNTH